MLQFEIGGESDVSNGSSYLIENVQGRAVSEGGVGV